MSKILVSKQCWDDILRFKESAPINHVNFMYALTLVVLDSVSGLKFNCFRYSLLPFNLVWLQSFHKGMFFWNFLLIFEIKCLLALNAACISYILICNKSRLKIMKIWVHRLLIFFHIRMFQKAYFDYKSK